MRSIRPVCVPLTAVVVLAMATGVACAQTTVVQKENVRMEYAQVLRAEPVYQTLRATSMVEQCEQSTPVDGRAPRTGFSRVVGAVKDVFTPGSDDETREAPADSCRMVPMEREFRRPIAYDVDYVHHGIKYRSRLPYDPGNRLRVRVSIMPVVTTTR